MTAHHPYQYWIHKKKRHNHSTSLTTSKGNSKGKNKGKNKGNILSNKRSVSRSMLSSNDVTALKFAKYVKNYYAYNSEYILCPSTHTVFSYGQLESCRKVITRIIKRQKPKGFFIQIGRVSTPYTQKSKNARMGKGKGAIQGQVLVAPAYTTLFIMRHVDSACAARCATQITKKLNMDIVLPNLRLPPTYTAPYGPSLTSDSDSMTRVLVV